MTARQRRVARRSRNKRGPILLGVGIAIAAVAISALSLGLWVLNVAADAPDIDELKPIEKGSNSIVYAADGTRLAVIPSSTIRKPLPLDRIPSNVREATIAIEDANFYEHGGVDFGAILRAAIKNTEAGEVVQGGSTITQQLVKNLYTGQLDDRNLEEKIQEAKLAEELEDEMSKDEILEEYLNSASYGTNGGQTSIGIEAAARQYFDKRAVDLELKEAALLAGLPQAPSLHNPLLNPKAGKERRNEVLAAMADQGYISQGKANRLFSSGLGVNPTNKFTKIKQPYFVDYVTQLLIDEYGANAVREGGLRVHTTLDLRMQKAAQDAIAGVLNQPGDPASAIVTTDPDNGNVLAMASSAEYSDRKFNLAAQGQRQPGSAFKTMVLTAAARRGVDPDATYYTSKSPLIIENDVVGRWEVNTFSNSSGGTMSLREATLQSDNTVYAQLDLDVGPEFVKETAERMGITSPLNGFPAEGIGGLEVGVTPLEMSNAYATLANGGMRHPPSVITRVEFPDGKEKQLDTGDASRAFPDGVAAEVTDVLIDNVTSGTGTNAQISCTAAGKTGTTDDFRDAWFAGYTPELSTAVWVGFPDEQRSMAGVHGINVAGGTFPAQIWGDYMGIAVQGSSCGEFPTPENPFQPKPFFGEYAKSSSESSSKKSTTTSPLGVDPSSTDPEQGDYDSGAYAPGIQDESDIPGSGNGNGNAEGQSDGKGKNG